MPSSRAPRAARRMIGPEVRLRVRLALLALLAPLGCGPALCAQPDGERLEAVPVRPSNKDLGLGLGLGLGQDANDTTGFNLGKELSKNHTFAFEYYKGFRMPGDELLVSDRRFFEFPIQDISLTLFYPKIAESDKQYLITAFRLRVHQDSPDSEGFITAGGIRLAHLGLRLLAAGATTFSYDLAIYGILHDLLSPDYNPSDSVVVIDPRPNPTDTPPQPRQD